MSFQVPVPAPITPEQQERQTMACLRVLRDLAREMKADGRLYRVDNPTKRKRKEKNR